MTVPWLYDDDVAVLDGHAGISSAKFLEENLMDVFKGLLMDHTREVAGSHSPEGA